MMMLALMLIGTFMTASAQMMKAADIEMYAKERYGDKWVDAAAYLGQQLTLDKNNSLTYREIFEAPGKNKSQLYVLMNYWATATFQDKQMITLNDKETGTIIINATMENIVTHTGGLFQYSVSITPVIKIDIKDEKVRVTFTVQAYDILRDAKGGILDIFTTSNAGTFDDQKRKKKDTTDRYLYDEKWELTTCYPFVAKDEHIAKRTSSKALVMTHAYSSAIFDKIGEAIQNGIVGDDGDDW